MFEDNAAKSRLLLSERVGQMFMALSRWLRGGGLFAAFMLAMCLPPHAASSQTASFLEDYVVDQRLFCGANDIRPEITDPIIVNDCDGTLGDTATIAFGLDMNGSPLNRWDLQFGLSDTPIGTNTHVVWSSCVAGGGGGITRQNQALQQYIDVTGSVVDLESDPSIPDPSIDCLDYMNIFDNQVTNGVQPVQITFQCSSLRDGGANGLLNQHFYGLVSWSNRPIQQDIYADSEIRPGTPSQCSYEKFDSFPPPPPSNPSIALEKTVDNTTLVAPGLLTYTITLTNDGDVPLDTVNLTDVLQDGSTDTLALTTGPDFLSSTAGDTDATGTLQMDEVWTFSATYDVSQSAFETGSVINTATVTWDGGSDTDNAETVFTADPSIALVKSANSATYALGDTITYRFEATNTGNVTLTNVTISDPLPGLSAITPPSVASLAPGTTATFTATLVATQAQVDAGSITNTATTSGTPPVGDPVEDTDDEIITSSPTPGIDLVKSANSATYALGDTITYTFAARNTGNVTLTNVTISDPLPRLSAITPPSVSSLAPGATATFTATLVVIQAQVNAGSITNIATASGTPPVGPPVEDEGTVTVRIEAEPVFQCSTVIGSVFDDINHDGYYNGTAPSVEDRFAITDQTYYGGKLGEKWGRPDGVKEQVPERGISGVRLITPNGLAVVTDAFGHFSLPCAALPAAIGSNFMLKLDTRTLPAGFRLTTENPRVVRVTPGMMTKMNFGVTISRVVRIDLSYQAFGQSEQASTPRSELVDGLRAMVTEISDTPAVLRISYQLGADEDERLAKQRMREVVRLLRQYWPANGRYQLNVETVIQHRSIKSVNE